MTKIPPPEEFLKERFLQHKHIEEIHGYQTELNWLFEYQILILKIRDEDYGKVIAKVNFLMNACLRKDNKAIDEFISQYGKIVDGSMKIDWEKIINNDY